MPLRTNLEVEASLARKEPPPFELGSVRFINMSEVCEWRSLRLRFGKAV